MPETQVKRLQGLSIKIINNLFAVSIKVLSLCTKTGYRYVFSIDAYKHNSILVDILFKNNILVSCI